MKFGEYPKVASFDGVENFRRHLEKLGLEPLRSRMRIDRDAIQARQRRRQPRPALSPAFAHMPDREVAAHARQFRAQAGQHAPQCAIRIGCRTARCAGARQMVLHAGDARVHALQAASEVVEAAGAAQFHPCTRHGRQLKQDRAQADEQGGELGGHRSSVALPSPIAMMRDKLASTQPQCR